MTPAGLMSYTGTASFEFMKLGYVSYNASSWNSCEHWCTIVLHI